MLPVQIHLNVKTELESFCCLVVFCHIPYCVDPPWDFTFRFPLSVIFSQITRR